MPSSWKEFRHSSIGKYCGESEEGTQMAGYEESRVDIMIIPRAFSLRYWRSAERVSYLRLRRVATEPRGGMED